MARSIYCYKCKSVKENPKEGYCRACCRKMDNERRLRTGKTKKHRTGKCACGNEIAPWSTGHCVSCASKWRKEYLNKNPELKQRLQKRSQELRKAKYVKKRPPEVRGTSYISDEHKFKHQVRALTRSYIKIGKLIKEPCEVCGTNELIEAHHDDYTKPMDIRWLCRKHHREHHKGLLTN